MSQPTRPHHQPDTATRRTAPKHTTGTGSLIRSLPAGTMEGPYSARFPSSPIGETSRRAPAGREAADERSPCARPTTPAADLPNRASAYSVPIESTPRLPSAPSSPPPAFRHEPVMVERVVDVLGQVGPGRPARRHGRRRRPRPGAPRGQRRPAPDRRRPGRRRPGRRPSALVDGLPRIGPRWCASRFDRLAEVGGDRTAAVTTGRRRCSSTSASARRSSTGPSGGSATATPPRSTCGWTGAAGPTAATVVNELPRGRAGRRCCGGTATSGSPPASPGPSSPPDRCRRPASWPTSCARPSRRRPAVAAATRPSGPSRPSASRSTTSSAILPGVDRRGHRAARAGRTHRGARATTRARTAS